MRFLGDIARLNARRFGSETALVFEGQAISFAELDVYSNGIGWQLLEAGVAPGDRVAVLAENCLEFFPLYFGILKIGAVIVPLNYRCVVAEIEQMMRDSSPRILFYTPAFEAQASEVAERIGGVLLARINSDLLRGDAEPLRPLPASFDERATAAILYTSGTTGAPKGAMLPHRALIECVASAALATGVRHSDRVVVTVPLFHGGGLYVVSHPHLYVGASIVLTARFEPDKVFELIERYHATTFFGVPAQYAMLLDRTPTSGTPSSLRSAWYGAAPMPVELVKASQTLWPNVGFLQCYGQTETTLNTVLPADEHNSKLGTVGRELPHIEVRVVDETGIECLPGVVGEVIVDKEAGMSGYFNNPEQTAETIRGGWIYTGDLGYFDDDRFLTLVDRKKDMIVSGGENIYSKEIEDVLCACEDVVEAAVVGGRDPKWGEVPVGFVVLSASSSFVTADLEKWCEVRLARYKVPRRWHVVQELPKTATGKIRKQALRQLLNAN